MIAAMQLVAKLTLCLLVAAAAAAAVAEAKNSKAEKLKSGLLKEQQTLREQVSEARERLAQIEEERKFKQRFKYVLNQLAAKETSDLAILEKELLDLDKRLKSTGPFESAKKADVLTDMDYMPNMKVNANKRVYKLFKEEIEYLKERHRQLIANNKEQKRVRLELARQERQAQQFAQRQLEQEQRHALVRAKRDAPVLAAKPKRPKPKKFKMKRPGLASKVAALPKDPIAVDGRLAQLAGAGTMELGEEPEEEPEDDWMAVVMAGDQAPDQDQAPRPAKPKPKPSSDDWAAVVDQIESYFHAKKNQSIRYSYNNLEEMEPVQVANNLLDKIDVAKEFVNARRQVKTIQALDSIRTHVQLWRIKIMKAQGWTIKAYLAGAELRAARRAVKGVGKFKFIKVMKALRNILTKKLKKKGPIKALMGKLNGQRKKLSRPKFERLFLSVDALTTPERMATYDTSDEDLIYRIKFVLMKAYVKRFRNRLARTLTLRPTHQFKGLDREKLMTVFEHQYGHAFDAQEPEPYLESEAKALTELINEKRIMIDSKNKKLKQME